MKKIGRLIVQTFNPQERAAAPHSQLEADASSQDVGGLKDTSLYDDIHAPEESTELPQKGTVAKLLDTFSRKPAQKHADQVRRGVVGGGEGVGR